MIERSFMVQLRFPDKDITDRCKLPFAITFLFYPYQGLSDSYNPNDLDFYNFQDYSDVLYHFLSDLMIESCISPLHCFDVDPDMNSKYKLPHYHVLITLGSGGKKSVRQWFELLEPIRDFISIAPFDKGDSDLETCCKVWNRKNKVNKLRSLLRYFKHMDNPEKYQYEGDLRSFGGFDIQNALYSQTDLYCICREIKTWIRQNNCYNFADLVDYADFYDLEWSNALMSHGIASHIFQYQKSLLYRETGAQDKKIDKMIEYANSE